MKNLNINDVEYPFIMNINVVFGFCKSKGIEPHEFGKYFDSEKMKKPTIALFEDFISLIKLGIGEGLRKLKQKIEIPDSEDILELISSPGKISEFFEEFNESMPPDEKQTGPNARGLKVNRKKN